MNIMIIRGPTSRWISIEFCTRGQDRKLSDGFDHAFVEWSQTSLLGCKCKLKVTAEGNAIAFFFVNVNNQVSGIPLHLWQHLFALQCTVSQRTCEVILQRQWSIRKFYCVTRVKKERIACKGFGGMSGQFTSQWRGLPHLRTTIISSVWFTNVGARKL